MVSIQYSSTPKADLPQYYYIFRKTYPLVTDIKNVAYSRLETILYLNIQKGKEAMNTEEFQQNIGGTASCNERPMMATKGCGQLKLNGT